jgi:membrane fusion protein, multidrug efflux system
MAQQIETEPVARKSTAERPAQRPPVRDEPAKLQGKPGRRSFRLALLMILLIPLAAAAGAYYYARGQSYQSTDDAFIDGHIINVAPKVSGRVERVSTALSR